MNDKQLYEMPMEVLTARILVAGQELGESFPLDELAADARQEREIRSLLKPHSDGDATGPRGSQSLDILGDILRVELDKETLGRVNMFDGRNDPEHGAVGAVYSLRDLTERGELISGWLTRVHGLKRKLRILDARMNGERIINRRFSV